MAESNPQLRLQTIAGSGNDLFGLDDVGVAWRYNFQRETWVRLKMAYEEGFESKGGGRVT